MPTETVRSACSKSGRQPRFPRADFGPLSRSLKCVVTASCTLEMSQVAACISLHLPCCAFQIIGKCPSFSALMLNCLNFVHFGFASLLILDGRLLISEFSCRIGSIGQSSEFNQSCAMQFFHTCGTSQSSECTSPHDGLWDYDGLWWVVD